MDQEKIYEYPRKKKFVNAFLDRMVRQCWGVKVFTCNGYQMTGQIMGWDQECLILEVNGNQQLVMRRAISTIVPLEQLEGN